MNLSAFYCQELPPPLPPPPPHPPLFNLKGEAGGKRAKRGVWVSRWGASIKWEALSQTVSTLLAGTSPRSDASLRLCTPLHLPLPVRETQALCSRGASHISTQAFGVIGLLALEMQMRDRHLVVREATAGFCNSCVVPGSSYDLVQIGLPL